MTRLCWTTLLSAALLVFCSSLAHAQYGAAVVSYDAGTTPTSGFTTATAAVGEPERFTGESVFPGIVSPFNPPFRPNEIVSVGEGGHITLRLSHYALPQAAGPEIGIFENVGLIFNSTTGGAGPTAATFGDDRAQVDVSADGLNWTSLGNNQFNIPSNGYTDVTDPFATAPGNSPSDFQKPFTGGVSSFNGLPFSDPSASDILELLAGSGGGTWLDISGSGLSQVGFIRFSVADDLNADSRLNFELDAVSIARGAVGSPIVPEPTTFAYFGLSLIGLSLPCRLRLTGCAPAESRPPRATKTAAVHELNSQR
jgi:hypothetical protein